MYKNANKEFYIIFIYIALKAHKQGLEKLLMTFLI